MTPFRYDWKGDRMASAVDIEPGYLYVSLRVWRDVDWPVYPTASFDLAIFRASRHVWRAEVLRGLWAALKDVSDCNADGRPAVWPRLGDWTGVLDLIETRLQDAATAAAESKAA